MYFKIIIKLDELATGLTIQQLHAFLPMYLLLVHNDDDDDGKTSFLVFDNYTYTYYVQGGSKNIL